MRSNYPNRPLLPNLLYLDVDANTRFELEDFVNAVRSRLSPESTTHLDVKRFKTVKLSDFWKLGHELFKSTPETFPAAFVPGDAFDPEFISPRKPFTDIPDGPNPTLDSLTSLTPLQGRISAIHASSFFHLFDEEKQFQLAKQVASLLSPFPGSIIFGIQGGRSEKGFSSFSTSHGNPKFCHAPESWTALWDGEVFSQGTVKVEAGLRETKRADGLQSTLLWWSIIRL
ncbi:hypothetical protein C8J56DRAFT_1168733 [Mycena floridula]|nr:hypothetical protein C8J56DRAFT_1168733 [Mycena floridula]